MTARIFRLEYAASTAMTCTLANLAAASGRESTAVDNTANRYQDALVQLAVKLAAGAVGDYYRVDVYAYGSEDGLSYTYPATGSDAAITVTTPTNLVKLGTIEIRDNTGTPTFISTPWSIAQAFGWSMPRKWGIVVVNRTSRAFAASGCALTYTGLQEAVE